MTADTADWASVSAQPSAPVTVSGTANIHVNDSNLPNTGITILTAAIVQAVVGANSTLNIVAGVANQAIRLLSYEVVSNIGSGGPSCRLEDTSGTLIASIQPTASNTPIASQLGNAPLGSGLGFQVHNNQAASSLNFSINLRYTQS